MRAELRPGERSASRTCILSCRTWLSSTTHRNPTLLHGQVGVSVGFLQLKTVQVPVRALYRMVRCHLLKIPQRPRPAQELFCVVLPRPQMRILWEVYEQKTLKVHGCCSAEGTIPGRKPTSWEETPDYKEFREGDVERASGLECEHSFFLALSSTTGGQVPPPPSVKRVRKYRTLRCGLL